MAAVDPPIIRSVARNANFLPVRSEALQQAKNHEHDRSGNTDAIVAWQESNGRRRPAHYQKRREECELPAGQITNASKNERAEWPHGEADRERRQRFQEARGRVSAG